MGNRKKDGFSKSYVCLILIISLAIIMKNHASLVASMIGFQQQRAEKQTECNDKLANTFVTATNVIRLIYRQSKSLKFASTHFALNGHFNMK